MAVSAGRGTAPRRLGLLDRLEPERRRRRNASYPYALGDRIAGDLAVIGHLEVGRLGHLYQVWSAREWCAFTCKILAPTERSNADAAATLRREGRILGAVRHPNLVRSYGEGEHDGLPFLLMEYLEGPSLFDVLEERPARRLEPSDAVRAAIHLGAALYHLHREGWLHLDLKPANLLLRDGVPVLIDMDAARRMEEAPPEERLGTGPYMAPEHVRGEPLGPAADIYGLGALLYELLTGRWPYEDVYTEAEPRQGQERQYPQLGSAPPPEPGRYAPGLSASLARTVLTCLAPDPADRFDSLHPLLLGLAAELEEPVSLWPVNVSAERRSRPREDSPPLGSAPTGAER
ncbi:MAG: serine/threonine-protein kinase [Gemmatimonadota bacterium]